MLTLRNWNLARAHQGEQLVAWGLVSDHPLLRTDISIHTSVLERATLTDGVLQLTTAANHLYTLMPEWFDLEYRAATAACLKRLGIDPGFADVCAEARARADRVRLAEDERQTAPGELLLEVIGTTALQALFRTAEGIPVPLTPVVHLGMFQDSVLLTDRSTGTVDFRYFPKYGRIEPYHISDGLHTVKVRNLGSEYVIFGREGHDAVCPAGAITAIPAAEHDVEGLISPDAVTGKSIFTQSADLAKMEQKD